MNRVEYFISKFRGKVLNIGCYGSESYDRMRASGYSGLFGLDLVEGDKKRGIVKGDALKMSSKNEFDVIIAGELIEHFYPSQAKAFLKNCSTALKKGGDLILTTPNKGAWSNRLFHRFDNASPSQYQGHVHVYTIPELKGFVEANGFRVKELFCLPYSREASPNQFWAVYALRKAIHFFLPMRLQEQIVLRAAKVVA